MKPILKALSLGCIGLFFLPSVSAEDTLCEALTPVFAYTERTSDTSPGMEFSIGQGENTCFDAMLAQQSGMRLIECHFDNAPGKTYLNMDAEGLANDLKANCPELTFDGSERYDAYVEFMFRYGDITFLDIGIDEQGMYLAVWSDKSNMRAIF